MINLQYHPMTTRLLKTGLLCLFIMGFFLANAQKPSQSHPLLPISGRVIDAASGTPLPGVRIQAYNDRNYTAMTGQDGTYTIKVPEHVTSLTMKVDGYNLVQCAINGRQTGIDAALIVTEFPSDYTETTSAVKHRQATGFDQGGALSIDPHIQAKLGADVRTILRSGLPGVGGVLFMNGLNSLHANAQPLIVIDGVLMDMQYNRSMLHDGYYNNLLANLNVNDIEKVTVVKNGTAIYGAKGANGVILIDMKRNTSMATKIDVSIFGGYELVPSLPSMMDATQYRSYASELLGSTGTTLTDFKFLKEDPNYYYYAKYHNNTDWQKETYRNAFTQSYGINVQGGDDVADYNLSVGYTDGNSTLKNNDFSRFNLRLNSDINLFKNLTTRFDASFSEVQRNLRDEGVTDDFDAYIVTAPGFLSLIKSPFLNPYAFDTQGRLSGFLDDADDYLDEVLGKDVSLANPSSILHYGEAKNKNAFTNSMINLAISPTYTFNRHFSLTEHFSYTAVNTYENYYLPMTGVPSFSLGASGTLYNMAQSLSSHLNQFFSDTRAHWNQRFNAHMIDVTGGMRYINNTYIRTHQRGYNTGNDKMPNMSFSLFDKTTSGADDAYKSLSYYVSTDYNYRETYYLTAGLSMETASTFGRELATAMQLGGVSWGFFPSVQAAWVVTSEPWFGSHGWLNYLKVHAGFDLSGNDDLDYTASRSYFTANRMLNAVDGLNIGNIGNTTLQWETTRRWTAGVDMNLLENRLTLQANVFKGYTDNLLTLKRLAYVSGLRENWSNEGSMENTGFDLSLHAKLVNTKDWNAALGLSLGHYTTTLTALSNNNAAFTTDIYGATLLTQVGSPVGLFYGHKTDGVYQNTDQALADGYTVVTKTGAVKAFSGGDMRFVDKTPDQVINDDDRDVIGDPNPDLFGNLHGSLGYKRLSVNVVFNYSLGNDVFNYQRSILEGGSRFFNQTTAMTNRWRVEDQQTDIPRITYGDPLGNSRFSDRWIEDGSYLRLKTLTLRYKMPLNNLYIKGFTLWGSAHNLLTLTRYLGGDPEGSAGNSVLSQGIDRGLLPQSRTFTLGATINL